MTHTKIAFFGTPDIGAFVLSELHTQGITPACIITNPDSRQGRKLTLTAPPVKIWADAQNIPVMQPNKLSDSEVLSALRAGNYDLFIVAAYGKIIPQSILEIPKYGTINMHPSLLPKLRGASPIRSAILNDICNTGVTIMLLDTELDHGPILSSEDARIERKEWPLPGRVLDERLARQGGRLLADTIPKWISGEITPQEQNHNEATFCTKITKDMGEINIHNDPYQNLLKIRAFDGWPGTYFFTEKNGKRLRLKITAASLDKNNTLCIERVIPEGKKEIDYVDFQKHNAT